MVDTLPILTLLWIMPVIGFLGIFLIDNASSNALKNTRNLAFFVSLFTFIFTIFIFAQFDCVLDNFQFIEKAPWLPVLDIRYHIGIDGISMSFLLLTSFICMIAVIAARTTIISDTKSFYANILLLEFMLIGAFISVDMIMFFIFFEGSLIPMFMIIGVWGSENRVYASFKIVLYTLTGSILMLIGIIAMCFHIDSTSMRMALNFNFSSQYQHILWVVFFIGFAVKIPMIPFHSWLPDAHVQAPASGSILLAGILLKLGGYGFLRFCVPMFPLASETFAPFVQILSIFGIIYASLIAFVQTDLKKMIAYSSIAHMGYVTLGMFTFKYEGMMGAMYQMLSHGVISSGLFMCVGILYRQTHTRAIQDYSGVAMMMPKFAVLFFMLMLGSIGFPGTSGFIGEFYTLISTYNIGLTAIFFAGFGVILGAVYMLTLFRKVFLSAEHYPLELKDVISWEKNALLVLVFIMLWMGIYPKFFMTISDASIKDIITILERNMNA